MCTEIHSQFLLHTIDKFFQLSTENNCYDIIYMERMIVFILKISIQFNNEMLISNMSF